MKESSPVCFASFLAPSIWPVYRAVSEYVARELGCEAEIVVGSSFDQFEKGEVDAGFI